MPPRPVENWSEALRIALSPRSIVVHARDSWKADILRGKFDFFETLCNRAAREGVSVHCVAGESRRSRWMRRGKGVHILVADRPGAGRRLLHALPGYVWGFWYLDRTGPNADSTLRDAVFDPGSVDRLKARYFFDGVAGHMLKQNVSRFDQPPRTVLTPAGATVFCQDIDDFRDKGGAYVSTEDMIAATIAACPGERVYIKLHPRQRPHRIRSITDLIAAHPRAELSTASVHDLSLAARVVVTQNSAAGFEALLQRRPVVTCARTDFHHATMVARSPEEVTDAIANARPRMAGFDYASYLYWFLGMNLLEPQAEDFEDRLWARIAAAGGF